ncbi:MAG: amidohydrolase family protein [bacterium]
MEYQLHVDQTWPPTDSSLGLREGVLLPPDKLDDPETIEFSGQHTVATPGWFNSHAHLELSNCSVKEYNGDFVDWIFDVLEHKESQDNEDIKQAFLNGCESLVQSGICHVVDHCDRTDQVLEVVDETGIDVHLFKELIGFFSDEIDEQESLGRKFLERASNGKTRAGLAPHAPYSAHPEVYQRCEELLEEYDGAISSHMHEIQMELEFTELGSGRFSELIEERSGETPETPYVDRPIPFFVREQYFSKPVFGIHLNYLNDRDYRWLESSSIAPVFCPRSYRHFGHDTLPVVEWYKRDIDFAMGTDSTASDTKLDLLNELRVLEDLTEIEIEPETILKSLTEVPSRVLGIPDRGVLSYGTPADISIFNVPSGDLEDLARGQAEALAVIRDGEIVWSE